MSDSANAFGLALLATLEARAKKKGQKSVVKGVVRRLKAAGASDQLIGEVAAVGAKKVKPPKVAKEKPVKVKAAKVNAPVKSKNASKAKAKKTPAVALHA
jgi:hypothetical protein